MHHALIIDDNMVISRAIQSRLEALGFVSFDLAWTQQQALAAAERHWPDLIVIGDDIETGCAVEAARRITDRHAVPVLMVTGDYGRARARLEKEEALVGPFLLNEIEAAVELANTR
ncbi:MULTISPECIES: response regulator [Novosphingobium]|uniref:DNA-binding response OmpR family regulator n=1 Tax=Novosphingobium sediminicola TaxID=563162 RepID=A0A7W6CFH9_9SPHN|nr:MULTISPECIES: response regulator [Novosphingobium]MBB3953764.1 DNA-binding response OmpR family regulator [Novosphingobium sediminicola]NOW48269.1 DNA-binding response OmpR family regulator [Novosphingobium sp. SG751A]